MGDVLLMGQSNAVGFTGDPADLPPKLAAGYAPIQFADYHGYANDDGAAPPTVEQTWHNLSPYINTFGPEITWGRGTLPAHRIFKIAQNSTGLETAWKKGLTTGYVMYSRMIAAVAAESADPGSVVWIQGEEDANTADAANAYEANLTQFIADLRSDFGWPTLPFWIVELRSDSNRAQAATIRAAQIAVAAADANAYLIECSDFPGFDGLHYTSQGYLDLGIRIAERLESIRPPTKRLSFTIP